ncbi:MAG TPA: calcium-binding protein [Allosphingosinicella sp.]|jgi:Ca2+-binding RTX toxin-like protein
MTVGTEGNDQLTNDTSKQTETVSALGGDDVVTINSPRVIASSADISVDGGSGYDILAVSALQFRSFANTGVDGSLAVRDSSQFNYFVSWAGIEELHLDGDLFQPGTYSLGGTVDILHLGTIFAGSYLLQTNGGNDQIYWQHSGSGTNITIDAGAGNDLIDFTGSGQGAQTGQGGDGNDTLIGSAGNDRLEGGNGDDVIDGKAGGDTMLGGAGNDIYYVDMLPSGGLPGDTVIENANEGTDEVRTALAAYALTANVENLTGTSSSGQALTGNGLDNHIVGGVGNDTLTGGDGNDILDGGAGADAMAGSLGNDIYYVDDAGDTVTENPGEGTDEVRTSLASYTLGPNVENLTGLTAGQTLSGNGLANVITAAPGSAVLHGAAGDDVLKIAGSGQAFGDTGSDTLVADFGAATGSVTVSTSANATDGGSDLVITDGALTVSGYSIENLVLTTGSGNDSFSATQGDDVVNPGSGTDSVSTLGGNDTIRITAFGVKTVNAGTGNDFLLIDWSNATASVTRPSGPTVNGTDGGWDGQYRNNMDGSTVTYSSVERFDISTGSAGDFITTASGDDVVHLGGGDDYVNVGSGNDTADGGAGIDAISANLSAVTGAVLWNLQTGSYSGPIGNFVNFEYFGTLQTGSGNDVIVTTSLNAGETIITGAGDDSVTIAGGGDSVDGGLGTDTLIVDYSAATQSVTEYGPTANASGGYDGQFHNFGEGAFVSYYSIEKFNITTGSGADTIVTKDGDDVVHLGGGDDFVDVGTGGDTADGGAGVDGISANLLDTAGAVVWNLQTNSFSNPGGPDSFVNFEYFGTIITAGGNDVITTAAGGHNETITTGAGNDTVTVLDGADHANMGIGTDTLVVDYHAATQGVITNIGPSANGVDGGWDGEYYNNTDNSHVDYNSVERFVITTGGGNDNIVTKDGNDVVTLNGGDDFVDVGTGTDSADGGTGIDGISADLSDATGAIVWNLKTNSFSGGPDSFANFEYFGAVTTGGGNDIITTASGGHNETINTGSGNDIVKVVDGADQVNGGSGIDRLVIDYTAATQSVITNVGPSANAALGGWDGEFYNNTDNSRVDYSSIEGFDIATGSGSDSITTADGNDLILTGLGDDVVHAAGGDDWVEGGGGNDTLDGGTGIDTLSYASAGSAVTVDLSNAAQQDTVGAGLDTLSNFEILIGSAYNDTLTGNGGANRIDGGAGADSMTGGAGDDVYIVDDNGDSEHELAGGGFDEVRSTATMTVLGAEVEKLTGLLATGQSLIGNASDNIITGAAGDDTIFGGAGADAMTGGKGNDTYDVDNAGDTVVEIDGEGTDTVRTSLASYLLAANVEKLVGTASSGQALTGNGLDNDITGSTGNDTIDGGLGADHMAGGKGDDIYYVDSLADVVVEQADQTLFFPGVGTIGQPGYFPPSSSTISYGANDQIITGLAVYTLPDNVEILTGTSNAGQKLTGNAGGNALYGADGNDVLAGGGSTSGDYLDGGAGDDRLVISTGLNSIVHGGGGTDTMVVQLGGQSVDISLGTPEADPDGGYTGQLSGAGDSVGIYFDGVEKFDITTGSGNDTVVTGGGGDIISTGAGNDVLDGGAGADTMTGGTGDDVYYVDDANDVVVENAGEGTDEIRTTLSSYTLTTPNVEMLTYVGSGDFHGTGSGGSDTITGGSGNDVLEGMDGNDYLDLSAGGNDRAVAGAGSDAIYFGGAYAAGDIVDGGTGTDTVGLRGDYSGGVTIAAGTFSNVEVLSLMTSLTATPTGYDITWEDGNLAAGQRMAIYAGNLQSGENVTFDGSAETHGYFLMYGGLGDDDLTGGSGSDGFYFGPGKFTQADHVDGGGGTQNQLGIDGSYDFSAASALGTFGGNFANIQTIVLYAGDPRDAANPSPNVYHIETNDAAAAANQTLTIYGTPVTTDLYFDGSAETDGAFKILSGTGNDTLIGGDGNDWMYGNLGADTLTGGLGDDTFAYTAVGQSAGTAIDTITDFGTGDRFDLSQIDADTTQAGDQGFSYIGASAFGHHAGELRVEFDQANNVWNVEGDVDGDGVADFILHVATAGGHQIVSTDFVA